MFRIFSGGNDFSARLAIFSLVNGEFRIATSGVELVTLAADSGLSAAVSFLDHFTHPDQETSGNDDERDQD